MKYFNGYIPMELIESIKNCKCILFVGSGLSSKVKRSNNKNLPSWKGLLEELLSYAMKKRIIFAGNHSDIKEMIDNGNLIMAAEELQEITSKFDFGDFLNNIFADKLVKPTDTHRLLSKIPFKSILTSNYDNLIEGAYALENEGQIPEKFTQKDLVNISSPLRKDDFYIFKIHGDLSRPDSVVLGSRDYQKLFFRSPEYRQFLETLFSVYTVLFVGYGGSDPDLINVLERLSSIFQRTIDKHYILLPEKRFNFTERKRLLLDKRLEVIEYEVDNTHSQVDAFVTEISEMFQGDKSRNSKKPYDVFISYYPHNSTEVHKVKDLLTLNGIKIWSNDQDSSEAIKSEDLTMKALSESRFMILIITQEYAQSKWLEKELSIGLLKQIEGKINVLPLIIGNVQLDILPKELSNIQPFKLSTKLSIDEFIPLINLLKENID